MSELPKVTFGGKTYYCDERLDEFRNIEDPHDRVPVGSALGLALCMVMQPSMQEA